MASACPPVRDRDAVGVCIIRVWRNPDAPGFRARITTVRDVESPDEQTTHTTDRAQVISTVARFLDDQRWSGS